jgi:hypothetical protein
VYVHAIIRKGPFRSADLRYCDYNLLGELHTTNAFENEIKCCCLFLRLNFRILCCKHAYMLQAILEGRRGSLQAVLVKCGKYVLPLWGIGY